MKTIREAINEARDKAGKDASFADGFRAGVEYQKESERERFELLKMSFDELINSCGDEAQSFNKRMMSISEAALLGMQIAYTKSKELIESANSKTQ